jgi:hypothetical protein
MKASYAESPCWSGLSGLSQAVRRLTQRRQFDEAFGGCGATRP